MGSIVGAAYASGATIPEMEKILSKTDWDELFDEQPVQSIGSLAIAPSDPNVVWVGTGEPHIRSHVSIGQGIYRSTDAGKSWRLMGLEKTGRIAKVIVHPTNPDVAYVAVQGDRIEGLVQGRMAQWGQRLDFLERSALFREPRARLAEAAQRVETTGERCIGYRGIELAVV
jgi:hypothetical protein